MARIYAKPSDYTKFLGVSEYDGDDGELKAGLRRASAQVENHIRRALYDVDTEGYPTDTAIAEAVRDATCAYVAYWEESGDITGANAVAGPVRILSVSLGGTSTGGASSRNAADTRRADEALIILANAGLVSTAAGH